MRLHYLLWQASALHRSRELQRHVRFDLTWHLTFANAWFGSLAPLVGRPFVYGPVGGGVGYPWQLARYLGMRGILYEATREVARRMGRYLNPLARLAWRRADLILAQNPETVRWLPSRHRVKAVVYPNAILEDSVRPSDRRLTQAGTALFVGRLLPLKGVAIAIEALAIVPGFRLVVMGDGPEAARLQRLAVRRGVAARVEWRGWQPREEVLRALREEADVFLFPSLHEEAGLAVAEALASGVPSIVFDRGGPSVVARQIGAEQVDPELQIWGPFAGGLRRVSGLPVAAYQAGHPRRLADFQAELVSLLVAQQLMVSPEDQAFRGQERQPEA
jgi:glycosyltransferase involved in cell wall biosynthesis